jgi:hypothetical protein
MALVRTYDVSFTDSAAPKALADPILTPSATPILYDFKNELGRVSGFNPAAPSFKNLGTYSAVGSITPPMASYSWSETKGAISCESSSAPSIPIEAATTSQIFNAASDFLVIAWISRRANDVDAFNATNYIAKGSGNTSTGDQTWILQNDGPVTSNLAKVRMRFSDTSGVANVAPAITGPTTGGAPVQVSSAWTLENGLWTLRNYVNGVIDNDVSTFALPLWVSTSNLSLFRQTGGTQAKGALVHRILVENLTFSKRTATAVIAADRAANQGRFSS